MFSPYNNCFSRIFDFSIYKSTIWIKYVKIREQNICCMEKTFKYGEKIETWRKHVLL